MKARLYGLIFMTSISAGVATDSISENEESQGSYKVNLGSFENLDDLFFFAHASKNLKELEVRKKVVQKMVSTLYTKYEELSIEGPCCTILKSDPIPGVHDDLIQSENILAQLNNAIEAVKKSLANSSSTKPYYSVNMWGTTPKEYHRAPNFGRGYSWGIISSLPGVDIPLPHRPIFHVEYDFRSGVTLERHEDR